MNTTSKGKRQVIHKKHPWKSINPTSLASRVDVHYAYLGEGVTARLKKEMRKGNGKLCQEVVI